MRDDQHRIFARCPCGQRLFLGTVSHPELFDDCPSVKQALEKKASEAKPCDKCNSHASGVYIDTQDWAGMHMERWGSLRAFNPEAER